MKKKDSKDTSTLTAEEIERFKETLLAKRREILGNVSSMENDTLHRERSDLSNMPIHMADAGTDNFDIENTIGLMDSEKKIVQDIYDALNRIEEGTFGVCENNGEQIPRKRLEAIPWTRYCLACASKIEKRANNTGTEQPIQ
jgi:RNA polymerase-binding protein DksA